jgi:hypothetical protein
MELDYYVNGFHVGFCYSAEHAAEKFIRTKVKEGTSEFYKLPFNDMLEVSGRDKYSGNNYTFYVKTEAEQTVKVSATLYRTIRSG